MSRSKLAIDGGPKAMKSSFPARKLFGQAEKKAVMDLFDAAIESGNAFGYNGAQEEAYLKGFCDFMGGGYADGVNSGTSAVYVALRACQVPAFSEVICGPISDPGGIMPIALANCIPVCADATPGTFNMDPKSVEKLINKRTGAILVAHIAGIPVEMAPIMKLAKKYGIPVIEDCAQAHGATYRGKLVGTIGHAAAFSTMSGKHHATAAQGGVVFTKDEATYFRVRQHSDRGKPFGADRANGNVLAALNLNSNDLAACVGRVQIKKLPRIIAGRRKVAKLLIKMAKKELKTVSFVDGPAHTDPVYWFLFGQLDLSKLTVDKAQFVAALNAEGLPGNVSYFHLFTEHAWYKNRAVFEGSDYPWGSPEYKGNPNRKYPVPNIRKTDTYTFQFPIHERVTEGKVKQFIRVLKKVETAYLK
jgi:perosamine synthetase